MILGRDFSYSMDISIAIPPVAETGGFGGDTPPVSGILSIFITSVRFVLDPDRDLSIEENISL